MRKNSETKNMLKDAGILFAITLIAGLILGTVYEVTKEPIRIQEEKKKAEACSEVFAAAAFFEQLEGEVLEEADAVLEEDGYGAQSISDGTMKALDAEGNLLGYVITVTTSEGYGGDIVFTMGVTMDGTINGISLLSISETPGLGMKAEEVLKPQFKNKKAEKFEYTKSGAVSESQIDAISGATITTNAITNGVNAGLTYFQTNLQEGGVANE